MSDNALVFVYAYDLNAGQNYDAVVVENPFEWI
jgi:hypothetical protein